MNRRQATVVPGVHRLQHVQGFVAPHLADDDAIRSHTQSVDDELTLSDGALAFDVGRPGFQPRDVNLIELKFGGIFDRCLRCIVKRL